MQIFHEVKDVNCSIQRGEGELNETLYLSPNEIFVSLYK